MTTTPTIKLRSFNQLALARDDLIAAYSDVRAELLHLPNYAVPAFTERLDRHGNAPGWAAVLAYTDDGEAVGYAYGNVIESDDRWWKRVTPTPAGEYTDRPAVRCWRSTSTSRT